MSDNFVRIPPFSCLIYTRELKFIDRRNVPSYLGTFLQGSHSFLPGTTIAFGMLLRSTHIHDGVFKRLLVINPSRSLRFKGLQRFVVLSSNLNQFDIRFFQSSLQRFAFRLYAVLTQIEIMNNRTILPRGVRSAFHWMSCIHRRSYLEQPAPLHWLG